MRIRWYSVRKAILKNVFILSVGLLCVSVFPETVFAQSEIDSLKRNSNLDSGFQPSSKPTLVTEFAVIKISGFVQPVLSMDNNIVVNSDLFITSLIPTTKFTDEKFGRFHLSASQSRLSFDFKFPKAGRNTSAFIEADFFSSSTNQHNYFRLRHAYIKLANSTIGQTWTNFGDVSYSPNTIDPEGPNS